MVEVERRVEVPSSEERLASMAMDKGVRYGRIRDRLYSKRYNGREVTLFRRFITTAPRNCWTSTEMNFLHNIIGTVAHFHDELSLSRVCEAGKGLMYPFGMAVEWFWWPFCARCNSEGMGMGGYVVSR